MQFTVNCREEHKGSERSSAWLSLEPEGTARMMVSGKLTHVQKDLDSRELHSPHLGLDRQEVKLQIWDREEGSEGEETKE